MWFFFWSFGLENINQSIYWTDAWNHIRHCLGKQWQWEISLHWGYNPIPISVLPYPLPLTRPPITPPPLQSCHTPILSNLPYPHHVSPAPILHLISSALSLPLSDLPYPPPYQSFPTPSPLSDLPYPPPPPLSLGIKPNEVMNVSPAWLRTPEGLGARGLCPRPQQRPWNCSQVQPYIPWIHSLASLFLQTLIVMSTFQHWCNNHV